MKRRGVLTCLGTLVAATTAGCIETQSTNGSTSKTSARVTSPPSSPTTSTPNSTTTSTTTTTRNTNFEEQANVGTERFSYTDGRCGTMEMATIGVQETIVEVVGVMKTPTPCHKLALAGVEYVDTDGTGASGRVLEVVVTTDGQRDGACATCVGVVNYSADIEVRSADFEEVRVVHKSMNGARTVATHDA